MLNPIDPDTVIRDGAASGRYPGQIHPGVAWWMGSCLVVVTQAERIVTAHDGHPTSLRFYERLCRGATHALNFRCRITDMGCADDSQLRRAMLILGAVPGIRIATAPAQEGETVHISLYDRDGQPLSEDAGLAKIRRMVAEDRVPRPVNDGARGRVEPYADQGAQQ
ncbi:hypothetical protein DMH15_12655 [Streptomyces sp. WAC 06725]|uniref:hypothetical protein n=1 Tax=Streptomyces sp. WAC 06725 TaxID=2203209 RepID=UPI000F746933|nr:hypothetical protein [Streptomyces sp. WAC 06725]RSO41840.1 hypothetical protein DMH15_12655 [Streptomyces sp. WAC 06725]